MFRLKKIIICSLLISFSSLLKAQLYHNEWIDFSAKYYKFQIAKTGFYRIDSLTLASSGINLNTINPKNFQLFIRGKEIPLYIKGESDNVMNGSDYIEFFSEKNNGRFDSTMYYNISYLPNPYVSLFNDTLCGFLTWNNSTSNNRLILETDTNYSSYTPAPYFYSEKIFTSNSAYNLVEDYPAADARYTQQEGFGFGFTAGNTAACTIAPTNIYTTTALPVFLRVNLSGASFNNTLSKDHELKGVIYDNANNPVTLFDTIFAGYKALRYSFSLLSNTLNPASNLEVTSVNNPAFNGTYNYSIVHYAYLKYPQIPDAYGQNSFHLFVSDAAASKTRLNINSVTTGTSNTIIFYDVTNGKRITTVINGGATKVLIPNSGNEKHCFLSSEDNVVYVTKLSPVNQTGFFVNYKSLAADSAFVIITHTKLLSEALNYKAYRQSLAGGSHNVILATIQDLYDQFAWGIEKHPLSIKNFCRFLIDSMPGKPRYLFLLGKSVQHDQLKKNPPTPWQMCLVPTMGVPPSDNLLTAGINSSDPITPQIFTGRLAAQDISGVKWYLDKIVDHESSPDAEWKKHVLHFAGGVNLGEQTYFQGCLNTYKDTIENIYYGGKVYDFKKTTSAPIQITVSDSVKWHFNYGTSLVTFFGHGSVSGFDQAIDDPNVYNNAKKYPFMLANSCYSGNIHLFDVLSNSEKFLLIDQKGAIGFLASASLGFANTLCGYSAEFYRMIARVKYGKSIGECIREACFKSASSSDYLQQLTALDMTYHGDPAVVLSMGAIPDYTVNNSGVSFDTKTYVDSIGVSVIVTNLGKAINDSVILRVQRFFPNNDSLTVFKKIKTPMYKDTIKFFMLLDYIRGIGLNKFTVFVDAYNQVVEKLETNNSTIGTVDLFIQGGDIVPVYPYKYAIIPNTPTLTLKASTSDPFAATRNYRLQLDTCDAFTSPIQATLIQSGGGVVEWTVSLPFADSTVYYWRVTKDSTGPADGYVWRESSFQVIGNKHGWGQSHFFQFKNDGFQFVKFKRPIRRFEFENDVSAINARTGMLPYIPWDNINWFLNGSVMHTWNCAWDGWTFVVFDSISAKPWKTVSQNAPNLGPGPYGNCHCDGSRPLHAFDFGASNYCGFTNWKSDVIGFINAIPTNNYVLAYSSQSHNRSSYKPPLLNAFYSIGSSSITNLPDTVPLIIFGRKGMSPGMAHEEMGQTQKSIVTLQDSIKTRWHNGFIASEIIGPSYKWNSLHWKLGTLDVVPGDTTVLKVIGIKTNGTRDTLATFSKDSLNVMDLYNYVNASTYPYMQLVAFMADEVNRTSPQLKRWQVLYDEAPECAINPKKGFKVSNDTLAEGDNVTFYFPVENIGTLPFNDSLVFTYWIEDANRVNHPLPQKMKAKPFNPQAIIMDTVKINSYQFPGNNALWIDVNPPGNSRYQHEQYHFNNIARYAFRVSRDVTNPLLDVTFDGVRIMNGDIVSAKPHILVSLKDENKFLALNDTMDFTVYVKKPSDVQEQRVYFAEALQFTPAQLPNNSCKIEYRPNFLQDGKYILIIQATDRSSNQSGAVDYRIMFEVVNKSTITQVINYPNPFSTSTRFVFNLTGSEVPDMFNIQIMTISGKIVKTITKEELGPLHVGRNITQYAWDGKDDFGDKLGNGVYLYKVQTKINGENIERKVTEADQYFTKEIGKMVIMR